MWTRREEWEIRAVKIVYPFFPPKIPPITMTIKVKNC